MKNILFLISIFYISNQIDDPFAGLSFDDDCETMKKK